VCTGGADVGLVGAEFTGAAPGGFIKPLRRAAPVIGSSFATAAFNLDFSASSFALEAFGAGPLYRGLLSVLIGPPAPVMLVIGLSPEMLVYRRESGAGSVAGFICFCLSTKGLAGWPNIFVSGNAILGFDARGRPILGIGLGAGGLGASHGGAA
jgi:hypothetical protein